MKREKELEALLVIATGFLVFYILREKEWMLYVSMAIGITGIFFRPLANLLARVWYKLGDWFGWVVSKVVLSLLFFLFLVPLALLYRMFHHDSLRLKKRPESMWLERNHVYTASDLTNIW
ncbi:MAG TPA: SxtJ family membrane protein [Prolixibacteraceae bacterium]|nr:SxtJ family membrane protein [Prolixibacteraceae bacterium]